MRNSRGSALLNAIVIAGIVAAISGVIMLQTKTTDESSRAPRIRAAMSVMQAKVQAVANQYTSYQCRIVNGTTDVHTCSFQSGLLTGLHQNITGAKCTRSGGCGVVVGLLPPHATYFDPVSLIFSALISYQGTEVAIAPIQLQFKVPTEVLAQQQGYLCPNATPIFQGYNANGSMNCQPLPTNCNGGGPILTQGTFITSVIDQTLVPNCNNLGALISCPANQYLSKYFWSGTAFASTCAPRTDPFVAENFASVPAGLPSLVTTVTTPTTTSTTVPSPTTTVPGPTTTTTLVVTTTTTLPLTAWNCRDGWAAGPPCSTGLDIVDDGHLSPNNPGVAWVRMFNASGNPATRCMCSSGVLTVVSCSGPDRYITCVGASAPPLACPWPLGLNVPKDCAPAYSALPPGGWNCLGPPVTFVPCP